MQIKKDLLEISNLHKAKFLRKFFKAGKGEYAQGDKFLGINVPNQRKIAKKYNNLSLEELKILLEDPYHEVRLTALIILVNQFSKADPRQQKEIYNFYLKNTSRVNNWDLVDLSAPNIVGKYLLDKNRKILYKLAKSNSMWERRIAILACFAFIKKNDLSDALQISQILLADQEDLLHKATGWMLREVGKKDKKQLENFLVKNKQQMPRVMLRYAIEKFPPEERKKWLAK